MRYLLILTSLMMSACTTLETGRYTTLSDTEDAVRALGGKTVNVGNFTLKEGIASKVKCRLVGVVTTPNEAPYTEYIRAAFIDELKRAGAYGISSDVTLTGTLDYINLNAGRMANLSGKWSITLTVVSSNGKSITQSIHHEFPTTFQGGTACLESARALMPAVQELLNKAVRNRDFESLLK